jgi:LppX_LprAFG lipoprotein
MAEDEVKTAGTEGETPGPRRGRRWIAASMAVVAIAIAVFVVAQGGGSGGGPLDAIARAAEVTQREPGGRALVSADVTVANSPEGVTESGSMIFDDSGRAKGEFTAKGHSTGKEAELTVVVDGTKSYVSSDALTSTPEGKKWMELDYSAANPELASSSPAEGGPQEGLKLLKKVQHAEEVGKEEIDGVATTHYKGTLSTSEKVFGVQLHFAPPAVDVWIDGQGRVRRFQMVVSGIVGESKTATTTTETIDFVEFGRVPKIEVPNPDEVFNATSKVEETIRSTESH